MVNEASLVMNGLRLLLEGYKLAREKFGAGHTNAPDPEKLEEVIADVEAGAKNRMPNPVEIEQEIDRKFKPEQAEKIKNDLNAIALLADPPRLEEFDYWETLTQITESLQAFARRTELFRLRGFQEGSARLLYFKQTSLVLVPKDVILETLVVRGEEAYGKEIISINVALSDSDSGIPVRVGVAGHLKKATHMGERYHEEVSDSFKLSVGSEKNRLLLTPDTRFGHFTPIEYRVTADQIEKIMDAMRADLAGYAAEIAKERMLASRLSDDVRDFVKKLSDEPS